MATRRASAIFAPAVSSFLKRFSTLGLGILPWKLTLCYTSPRPQACHVLRTMHAPWLWALAWSHLDWLIACDSKKGTREPSLKVSGHVDFLRHVGGSLNDPASACSHFSVPMWLWQRSSLSVPFWLVQRPGVLCSALYMSVSSRRSASSMKDKGSRNVCGSLSSLNLLAHCFVTKLCASPVEPMPRPGTAEHAL